MLVKQVSVNRGIFFSFALLSSVHEYLCLQFAQLLIKYKPKRRGVLLLPFLLCSIIVIVDFYKKNNLVFNIYIYFLTIVPL